MFRNVKVKFQSYLFLKQGEKLEAYFTWQESNYRAAVYSHHKPKQKQNDLLVFGGKQFLSNKMTFRNDECMFTLTTI